MSTIEMPRLSDSMEQGTILTWLKSDGDLLSPGDELVEVETDKATVTVNAEVQGLLSIVAAAGSTVAPGEVIARVLEAGEERDVAPEIASEDGSPVDGAGAVAGAAPVTAAPPSAPAGAPAGGPLATPLARRAAAVHGVTLAGVPGTGPRGRITRSDVLAAAGVVEQPASAPAASAPAPAASAPAPAASAPAASAPAPAASAPAAPAPAPAAAASAAPGGAPTGGRTQPLSRLQLLIARRMTESRTTIPEFEVQTEVAMDAALAFRETVRGAVPEGDPVPSLNDLVVKACALALRRHPALNASWAQDAVTIHDAVNIGVAVATDDALIVPTIRDADRRSLGSIALEARRLAARVRACEIAPAELDGGTFTVSNLGMLGMTAIRPVINPPQVAILGVGSIRPVLAREQGEIVDRQLMTITLSADHRAVYGADAARFLQDVRGLLEQPLALVL